MHSFYRCLDLHLMLMSQAAIGHGVGTFCLVLNLPNDVASWQICFHFRVEFHGLTLALSDCFLRARTPIWNSNILGNNCISNTACCRCSYAIAYPYLCILYKSFTEYSQNTYILKYVKSTFHIHASTKHAIILFL